MLELAIVVLSGVLIIGVAVEVGRIVIDDELRRHDERVNRACRREMERW